MITAQDALVDFKTMGAEDVWKRFRGIGHQVCFCCDGGGGG